MTDMFIKIGAIKGESKDAKHPDEIEVLSWAWGESQSVGAGGGTGGAGGGAGKVTMAHTCPRRYSRRASRRPASLTS